MKVFLVSVAAAIILAVISVYALDVVQKPTAVSYQAPGSVRL